jgi:protein phosphatase
MNTPGGASALHWISGSATDKGRVRATNQDAYLDRPDFGIWAVADGMGGHSDGAVASRAIVEALSLVPRPRHLGTSAQAVREVLQRVNRRLLEQAAARPDGDLIGSTAVVLIALDHHCTVLWVGDSRAYRLRDGDLTQITVDHSQVQALIDGGLLSSGDADGHPLSNVLLRAVGSEQDLLVDGQVERLAAGDRYLLCSDGLYRELDGGTLAALLGTAPPSEVVQTLVHQACERGGRDNVTAVVIDFL